jgi:hypothetical protein
MITFYPKDVADGRKVLLNGRIVTVIDLAGRKALIAEDGKWHENKYLYELTDKDTVQVHLEKIASLLTGKTIATLKSNGTGVELVLEDNTRLGITYHKEGEGISFSVTDSGGTKVL